VSTGDIRSLWVIFSSEAVPQFALGKPSRIIREINLPSALQNASRKGDRSNVLAVAAIDNSALI